VNQRQRAPTADPDALRSPIDLPSIPDVIYGTLRRDIARGIYKPGPIRVRPIAERFGVSATPVREALRRLEAEGLVSLRNRQIVVNALSAEELQEIFAIRSELETFAVGEAAGRIARDPGLLAKLGSLIDAMDREEESPDEWRAANEAFHMSIYGAARMPRLEALIMSLWIAVEPYLRLYVTSPGSLTESQAQHRAILDALRKADAAAAQTVLREHLRATADVVSRGFADDV
jgi:DNA-binding GntR family transcriptional regulator